MISSKQKKNIITNLYIESLNANILTKTHHPINTYTSQHQFTTIQNKINNQIKIIQYQTTNITSNATGKRAAIKT